MFLELKFVNSDDKRCLPDAGTAARTCCPGMSPRTFLPTTPPSGNEANSEAVVEATRLATRSSCSPGWESVLGCAILRWKGVLEIGLSVQAASSY